MRHYAILSEIYFTIEHVVKRLMMFLISSRNHTFFYDDTHVKNGGKLYCHGHSISAIVSNQLSRDNRVSRCQTVKDVAGIITKEII